MAEQKFGQPFDLAKSDIDLFAVSEELFGILVEEFKIFIAAWQRDEIRSRHPLQEKYWNDYLDKDPNNIKRGFLDGSHVPTFDRFPAAQKIGNAAFKFHVNFESVTGIKLGKKASIRIYRDWECAVRQMAFTLKGNLQRRGVIRLTEKQI